MTGVEKITEPRYRQKKTRAVVKLRLEQRRLALVKANETRRLMKEVRLEIHALSSREGRALVAAMLDHPDESVDPIPIGRLIACIRRMTPTQAERLCIRASVVPSRRVREISPNGRDRLAAALRS